ncbi:MAG: METTL5 family protein [Methanobacteriota archaeon]
MKRISLEIALQNRPQFPSPDPSLEQYLTPAPLAADILYWALAEGDIQGKSVLDLGCGTGIFAVGASLLGANRAVGVDLDGSALTAAREFAGKARADVGFVRADANHLPFKNKSVADTVLMNPPFGSQKRHADRPFAEAAASLARVVYCIHLAETEPFARRLYEKLGARSLASKTYKFEIPHTYEFHRREKELVDVAVLRVGMVK